MAIKHITLQKEVLGLKGWGPFMWTLHNLPVPTWNFARHPSASSHSAKTWILNYLVIFKLDGGVTVSINVFLSLCDRDTNTVTDTVTCPELDKPIKRDGSKTAKITY